VEALPLVFSSGWASGLNAYLVVLVLGISDRLGDVTQIPDALARWDVLAAAGFLYAMEFVADKIPYIDSTWDAISTAIRPTARVRASGKPAPGQAPRPRSAATGHWRPLRADVGRTAARSFSTAPGLEQ